MDEEIVFRIKRVYSAIGETIKTDFTDIKQETVKTNTGYACVIDFKGGYTDEQISNFAHMAISNVANLRNHIERWLRQNGKDESTFNRSIADSPNVKAIIDLNNNEKHGYPPRDKGLTKKSIKLNKITRSLQVRPAPAGVAFPATPDGNPIKINQGIAQLVVTGQIVDGDNNHYGDLHKCLLSAISEFETIISAYA